MVEHLSPNQMAWRRFRRNRPALVSAFFLLLLLFLLALISLLPKGATGQSTHWLPAALTHDPTVVSDRGFEPPSQLHWCGTDVHGRDLLGRLILGARVSLLVGVVGAAVALVIGVSWGAVAGYLGGRWDNLMMRLVDIFYSLPSIIFVIVLISTLEAPVRAWLLEHADIGGTTLVRLTPPLFLVVGLGLVSWLNMARIVRGQVLSLRQRSFVEASRALGAGTGRILWRHILPNVYGVVIVYLTLTVPSIILYESFLSFLGFGIQPPMASWGSLLAEGAQQLNPIRTYWWLIGFPAAAMVSSLVALNFFGDGVRDAFEPRARS